MKLGMTQIVTKYTAKDFIKLASDIGYSCVELGINYNEGSISPNSSDEEIKDVVDYAKSLNIDIVSTCIGSGCGNLLDSGVEQTKGIDEAKKAIEVTAKLGAKTMLHTLGRPSADLYYEDAYENGKKALKEIATSAQKAGAIFTIEMVWNGFLFSPLEMRSFIDSAKSEYIGFYMDPGNMAVFNHPHHWVRALGNRTKMVHLKDWIGNAASGGTWPPLLDGDVDFEVLLKELKAVDYDPIFIHEVDEATDSFENSLAKMQEIVKSW